MNRHARWLAALAVAAVVVLPFVAAFLFIHQSYDDAGFLLELRARGLLGSQAFWYRTFSGRFTSNATVTLLSPAVHYPWLYRLACLGVMALLAYAIHAVLRAALGLPRLPAATLSLLVLATFLAMAPGVAEGFYWLTGTATYTLGTAFLLLAVAGTLSADSGRRNVVATTAWTILAVGMNEVALLLMDGYLALFLLRQLLVERRVERRSIAWMAAALLATIVSLAAPGNWNRLDFSREVVPKTIGLGDALVMAVRELAMATYYLVHVSSLLFLLLAAVLLTAGGTSTRRARAVWQELMPLPAFAGVFLAVLAFFIYAQGGRPIPRVMNPVYLAMIVLAVIVAVRTARTRDDARAASPLVLALVLAGFLSSAGRAGSGARIAWAEMASGQWRAYDREVEARRLLAQRQRGRDAVVPPIATRPSTIFVFDIGSNPALRHNVLYAYFHGTRTIRVAPRTR